MVTLSPLGRSFFLIKLSNSLIVLKSKFTYSQSFKASFLNLEVKYFLEKE